MSARSTGPTRTEDERVPPSLAAKHALANRLVFSKWRDGVGGKLRFFVSGGAPLSKKLSYAFWAAGIPILQGYGMTEACIVSANRPEDNKIGSIGKPFADIEMRISEKDGEILIRGPNVMRATTISRRKPPASRRRRLLPHGRCWLSGPRRTFLHDRPAQGPLQALERQIRRAAPGRKPPQTKPACLTGGCGRLGPQTGRGPDRARTGTLLKKTMKEQGVSTEGSREELAENAHFVKRVQNDAIELTRELSDYERVKRVYLLPREFSIERAK